MAVTYFPDLILRNLCHNITCCFQVRFGTLLVGHVTLFFSFIFQINVKALVSFTGKNDFVVSDASFQPAFQGLTKRSDRFDYKVVQNTMFPEKLIL